jgi:hypothetical protein
MNNKDVHNVIKTNCKTSVKLGLPGKTETEGEVAVKM